MAEKISDERLNELLEATNAFSGLIGSADATGLAAALTELAALRAAQANAEPVAWLLSKADGEERLSGFSITDGDRSLGWHDRPLYLHPAPLQVTEEMVEREWMRLLEKDDRTSPEDHPYMALITRAELATAITAALGAKPEVKP
jgi:hypothetical protein